MTEFELEATSVLVLEPHKGFFEKALVGVARQAHHSLAVYSTRKVIDVLMADGASFDDAYEHFEYNVVGSYVGEETPIFLDDMKCPFAEDECNRPECYTCAQDHTPSVPVDRE
jgi:hypothetical protein